MDENPYKAPYADPVPARRSLTGIASFAIALTAALAEAVTLPLAVYIAYSGVSNKSTAAFVAMFFVLGACC